MVRDLEPRTPRAARAHEYARFPKDRSVEVSDGARIAFTVLGAGPEVPVVFVNGWSCNDAYWAKVGPAVAASAHPAVFLDLRGHGESGLPRRPGLAGRSLRSEDVAVERLAQDIVAVMDDAGIGRGVLVGHSVGVQIAVEVCRIAPERVAGLVAVAGAFENPVKTLADLPVLDRLYPIADAIVRFLPLEMLRPVLRRAATPTLGQRVARAVGAVGPKVSPEDMAAHMHHVGDLNASVLLRMLSSLRAHRTAAFLPEITAPTLVLAGRHDRFTPPRVLEAMADAIPDAQIVEFEHAGHLLPIEEPEGVTNALVGFLEKQVIERERAIPPNAMITAGP